MCKEREIEIEKESYKEKEITRNRIIIEYAIEYIVEQKKQRSELKIINYVRQYKRVLILFELFGLDRRNKIDVCLFPK